MLKVWFLLYRDKMQQAYEFALDKVGVDFNSYQVSRYNIALRLIFIYFFYLVVLLIICLSRVC